MESEKWYIVGASWGDPCFGCYNGVYIIGVYGEKEFCEVFAEKLRRLYGLRTYVYFNWKQSCYRGCASGKNNALKCAFEEINSLGQFGRHKWHVPIELFHEDDDARKFALMGYSDAEGCCSSVLDNGDRRVRWKSVNKTGLLQIKELLRTFGISTRKLTSDRSKNGKVKSAYPCWELVIGDHVNLSKFYRYVGFGMQSKQTKLRNALMSYKQRSIIERIVNIKYVENSTIIGAPWCRSA